MFRHPTPWNALRTQTMSSTSRCKRKRTSTLQTPPKTTSRPELWSSSSVRWWHLSGMRYAFFAKTVMFEHSLFQIFLRLVPTESGDRITKLKVLVPKSPSSRTPWNWMKLAHIRCLCMSRFMSGFGRMERLWPGFSEWDWGMSSKVCQKKNAIWLWWNIFQPKITSKVYQ